MCESAKKLPRICDLAMGIGLKDYWRINEGRRRIDDSVVYYIYTITYDSSDDYNTLISKIHQKLGMEFIGIHYHSQKNYPIFIRDTEDIDIFLQVQDLSDPKKGLDVYLDYDCPCLESYSQKKKSKV